MHSPFLSIGNLNKILAIQIPFFVQNNEMKKIFKNHLTAPEIRVKIRYNQIKKEVLTMLSMIIGTVNEEEQETIIIECGCPYCSRKNRFEMPSKDWYNYIDGKMPIEKALPYFSTYIHDWIKGICPICKNDKQEDIEIENDELNSLDYEDDYEEEEPEVWELENDSRYTISYDGFIFDGDSKEETNYINTDNHSFVTDMINNYGQYEDLNLHIKDNYYGISWWLGEWS